MRAIDFTEALTANPANDFVPFLQDTGGGVYAERKAKLAVLQPEHAAGGKLALGNAVSTGAVTGLGLAVVPSAVTLTVQKDAGAQNIFAVIVGAPTTDGFAFELSADTDSANYVLHYQIAF